MSENGSYILFYEPNYYAKPTPMDKDRKWLVDKYGGEFKKIDHGTLFYWNKPNSTLMQDQIENLWAVQVMEYRDYWPYWRIVKRYGVGRGVWLDLHAAKKEEETELLSPEHSENGLK